MKVSVLQENLARGLSIVSRAVSPRSTLPVLANVLVASDEGRLRLSPTNLELGITCWIGAKISDEGSTTVPARTFLERGLLVTLNTDDPGISGIDLAHEYNQAAPAAGWSPSQIQQAQRNAVEIAFLSEVEKKALLVKKQEVNAPHV